MEWYKLASLSGASNVLFSLNANWTTWDLVGQFFSIFMWLAVVIVLAYITIRLMASVRYGRGGRRNLEILESMSVGVQSYVHIVRVGGQYVLIGVTRGQINMLQQLETSQLKLPEEGEGLPSFDTVFSKFQNRFQSEEGREKHHDNESDKNS